MDKAPVFVLTGFLGAGKSTLLNRLLADPAFCDTAVIINEFGDVALDHDLVRVGESQVSRTTTGCLCCTVGSDIRSTLHELHVLAGSGDVSFDRVIVETTGLADPAPLVTSSPALMADAWHMSTHAAAMLIAAFAHVYARRHARDPRFAFETGKLGDLAGFASAVVLALVIARWFWD